MTMRQRYVGEVGILESRTCEFGYGMHENENNTVNIYFTNFSEWLTLEF